VIGDASGDCAPSTTATPVAEGGSVDLLVGGTTPVSGTAVSGETPGVVTAPDAMACGNGAGILGDGSGTCTPAMAEEPLTPLGAFGLDLEVGGTTPLEGSSAVVDLSTTAIDPGATVCGNGAGAFGDGSATCGSTGSPAPALRMDPAATAEVVVELGQLDTVTPALPEVPDGPEAPGAPALPIDPFGGLTPLLAVPVVPAVDGGGGTVGAGPVRVGGLGGTTTPVAPAPAPSPARTRPGFGLDGSLTPIGGAGAFGSVVPLGTASGTGAADLTATGSVASDLLAGTAAAALALTGFGIRNALSLASVLLALGALLLAGRRRVELLLTVS
jgi:hypothetical protein